MRKNTHAHPRGRGRAVTAIVAMILFSSGCVAQAEKLPDPDRTGAVPLESLMQERSSIRSLAPDSLTRGEVSQLLWAAGGITTHDRFARRTTPSAGALYPLEFYLVEEAGISLYNPHEHSLEMLRGGDHREALCRAALGQMWAAPAPAIIAIAAVPARTKARYGERGDRYVLMESGFSGQNILLQVVALDLGATVIGAFDDDAVSEVLQLPDGQEPLLLIPVGRKAE